MNQRNRKATLFATVGLSLLAPLACATDGTKPAQDRPAAAQGAAPAQGDAALPAGLAAVPGIRQAKPALYSAAQPLPEQWDDVAAAGVTTVINLRPDAELAGRDERSEVAQAGMRYVQLPVAGAEGITEANADALMQALQQADGPVLVHCASGNRVGALLAIGAARAGMPVEEAIAYGRSAGLGSGAEAVVRKRLDAEAKAD